MAVILEAIKFNHDHTSATTGAFNIRRDELKSIGFPEWQKGESINPEDSPVAYCLDKLKNLTSIVIKARFTSSDRSLTKIRVKALEANTPATGGIPNVLGESGTTLVNLRNGESGFEDFTLSTTRISQLGVGIANIAWQWVYALESDPDNWINLVETQHRIYTVVSMPQLPWVPTSSDTQVPWTDVLDHACRWAAGATDMDAAATRVTKKLNSLGDDGLVRYDDPNSGGVNFVYKSPFAFDCTEFLKLLMSGKSRQGRAVNCDDCAAIVVTFANLLGCQLSEGTMGIPAFFPRPHLRIGLHNSQTGRFDHHTAAWKGACGEDDKLFDACLQLDRNDPPKRVPQWFVPTNILFGQLNQHEYRFRLADEPARCLPSKDPRHRRIGLRIVSTDHNRELDLLKLSQNNPFVAEHVLKPGRLLEWQLADYQFIEIDEALYLNESFWNHETDESSTVAIDAYECVSRRRALALAGTVLSTFQLSDIDEQHTDFGDIGFSNPSHYAIVFVRDSFVFRFRNTGAKPAPCDSFARLVDKLLIS